MTQCSPDSTCCSSRYTAAIILDIAYGRNIATVDDEFIRAIEEGIGTVLEGAGTGGTVVDYLPACASFLLYGHPYSLLTAYSDASQ